MESSHPYPYHFPAFRLESASHNFISRNIPGYFLCPVRSIVLWHPAFSRMPVPENTINKHRYSFAWKSYIGLSEKGIGPTPPCDSLLAEHGKQPQLG